MKIKELKTQTLYKLTNKKTKATELAVFMHIGRSGLADISSGRRTKFSGLVWIEKHLTITHLNFHENRQQLILNNVVKLRGHRWFAWRPVKMETGEWRWLEYVWKRNEYVKWSNAEGGFNRWIYT
jgi:hypothetical protein